jgi:inositol 1,4,5-triphosphate receptor type 1
LLCENHNLKLQDHLREQNNKDGITLGKNFDFPTFISNMLGLFSKHANIQIMELGGMLIDALIEFVQGPCHGNQKALISAKIIDNCRDFIAGYQEKGYENEMKSKGFDLENSEHLDIINETKQKLTTLLLALLEGIPDSFVINRMSQSLDFTMMKNRMYYVYKNFVIDLMNIKKPKDENIISIPVNTVNNNLKLDSLEGSVLEGFDIYILLQTLSVYSKQTREHLEDSNFTPSQKRAYEFFACHTGRIEVNVENTLQRTYFPIKPVCKYLDQNKKEAFKYNADRTSPNTKIRSLMESSKTIILEMYHDAKVENDKWMISPKIVKRVRDFSTFLAVIINIIMLIFYQTDEGKKFTVF